MKPRTRKKIRTCDGKSFQAVDLQDDVLIDPLLPPRFDTTPNDDRPESHQRWWHRPFIVTYTTEDWEAQHADRDDEYAEQARAKWRESGRDTWLAAWPGGTRYDVRCLDGGAWDRSTAWGAFGTLAEAIRCAQSGPSWRGDLAPSERGHDHTWSRETGYAAGDRVTFPDGVTRTVESATPVPTGARWCAYNPNNPGVCERDPAQPPGGSIVRNGRCKWCGEQRTDREFGDRWNADDLAAAVKRTEQAGGGTIQLPRVVEMRGPHASPVGLIGVDPTLRANPYLDARGRLKPHIRAALGHAGADAGRRAAHGDETHDYRATGCDCDYCDAFERAKASGHSSRPTADQRVLDTSNLILDTSLRRIADENGGTLADWAKAELARREERKATREAIAFESTFECRECGADFTDVPVDGCPPPRLCPRCERDEEDDADQGL